SPGSASTPLMTTRLTSPPAWVSISSSVRVRLPLAGMRSSEQLPLAVRHNHQIADMVLVDESLLRRVKVGEFERPGQQGPDPASLDVLENPAKCGARALRGAIQLQRVEIHGAQVEFDHGPGNRPSRGAAALRAQEAQQGIEHR